MTSAENTPENDPERTSENRDLETAGPAGSAPVTPTFGGAPRPTPPRPRPPVPGPPRRAATAPAPVAPPAPAPSTASEEAQADARQWGRVAEDGTVFVRTADGERPVGQMPDATPKEALDFFVRRYTELLFEVELLETRVAAGALAPDEAAGSVKKVHAAVREAQAVGDLTGLDARLDALGTTIAAQRERRREERAARLEVARADKERIVDESERLAEGSDWRNGANRLRQLLEEWKALPRLDKAADDTLWRRFSGARTTYTRRRKAHFAQQSEKQDDARVVKERLVTEAEALSGSTEWGPTAGKYRDLMSRWKAAGPAPKGVDDQLWRRFRAAQDVFFGARDATNAELDQEFAQNAVVKEALLVEAEALLPVTDLRAAKEAFRGIADRWDAAGKVPRDRMKDLEARIRRVEQAIRGTEDDQWRRSNPEARARAADTVAQLETSLADLRARHTSAVAAGNTRKAEEHAASIEAREAWLVEAQRALHEFS